MTSLLIVAILISGLTYFATFKLRRKLRVAISLGAFSLIGVLPIAFVLLGGDSAACFAYSDQCSAKRISGLSQQDCLARDDVIAYLQEGSVCLVDPDNDP